MLLIPPLYIISYIIFSLHLPSGVRSFAIQTSSSSNTQQQKVWIPPSQQQQKRGNIFSITNPEDLLDFIIEDDKLCVVKVYASWCTTCKKFDLRYRKIASQYGDKQQHDNNHNQRLGQVRFAELQYDKEENREICNVLNATSFPYIIMYKGSKGKIREFQCTPAKINLLVDAIKEELANESSSDGLSQQVIGLGLAGKR